MNFLLTALSRKVVEIFRQLMLTLSTIVCELIIFVSDLFVRLGKAQILTTSQINEIYSRVALILGVFMLFKLTFSFIKYLIDPETVMDKSKGAAKIVVKAVVVVALLGLNPFIFQQAFKLQEVILDSNIIGKVIMASDASNDVSNFGQELSLYLFTSFYSAEPGYEQACEEVEGDFIQELKDEIKYNHTFTTAHKCLNQEMSGGGLAYRDGYVVNFKWHGLILLAVSLLVLYILVSYCFSVGVRVVQLAFLQLIAPIPILSYLGEDKEGAFSNWIKRCVSTFIDLFIRMAIIYFVVFIIGLLMNTDSDSYNLFLITTDDPTGFLKTLLTIILILGLLAFAKKAPDLLKELLPKSIGNNIGFGIGFKNNDAFRMGAGAVAGTAVGLIGGALGGKGISRFTGALGGAISGVARGTSGAAGGKWNAGVKNQQKANLTRAQRITAGTPWTERAGDTLRGAFGIQSGYASYDTELAAYDQLNSLMGSEDVIKFQEQSLNRANEALSDARLKVQEAEVSGDSSKIAAARSNLLAAERNVTEENNRLSGIKDAVFNAINNGESAVSSYKFKDADGNSQDGVMADTFKPSGSEFAAMEKVVRVNGGQKFKDRGEFKNKRYDIQAEKARRNKSG